MFELSKDIALRQLADSLLAGGYAFIPPTPSTHRRVNARPGNARARNAADVFGWNRPTGTDALSARQFDLAMQAGAMQAGAMQAGAMQEGAMQEGAMQEGALEALALERHGALWRSRYRLATLGGMAFWHSAHPTDAADSVFFGPDTYRFARALSASLAHLPAPRRAVDIGCGSGAGGLLVARAYPAAEIVLADINPAALRLARINAAQAGLPHAIAAESDVLRDVPGRFDLIIANPPYMADPLARAYRHGGGVLGEGLSLRIVAEAIPRLADGGTLLLYTGCAIVNGQNGFLRQARAYLDDAGLAWSAEEIDPDVFGEELDPGAAMSTADRIAVIWLVARRP